MSVTAIRAQRPGWRDPRLVGGLVLLCLSVSMGAWLLSAADDTIAIATVRRDAPAGTAIGADDLDYTRVHFEDGDAAERYVHAGDELPDGAMLEQPLVEGELVPRAAVVDEPASAQVEVPLSVGRDDVPATVRVGSVVDVWVVPRDGAAGRQTARLALRDVTVLDLGARADALAPEPTRQVIVGVPEEQRDTLAEALGTAASGRLVLTRLH